ncbi:hypothetical protein OPT61_g3117 [Boeremia exigua]|uniref:Uncharacterized protein n=1 Tax=Boeremia exigua TaxID=749465 RepID=A0ACC2IJ14_9PLEO|nr:hypothetical protein OPT61_g3117 [Boeremia exigua]
MIISTKEPYKLNIKYVSCFDDYTLDKAMQQRAIPVVARDIKHISAVAESLRWVITDIKDCHLEAAARSSGYSKTYEDMLRYLFVQLRWICGDPLVELQDKMPTEFQQAPFPVLSSNSEPWDHAKDVAAWTQDTFFGTDSFDAPEVVENEDDMFPDEAADEAATRPSPTFENALEAADYTTRATARALRAFHGKLRAKVASLMSVREMLASPILTRSAHELMAQNAFCFNLSLQSNVVSINRIKGFRESGATYQPDEKYDLKQALAFDLRNRRLKSDFNDKIGHPQAGTPSCLFVCAHTATVPTTTNVGPRKYEFANNLWTYIRDSGFGTDFKKKFQKAAEKTKKADEDLAQQQPNMNPGLRL